MAARKKRANRKTGSKRKPAKRKTAAARKAMPKRSLPKVLPSDEAWRELVETAIEHPEPGVKHKRN